MTGTSRFNRFPDHVEAHVGRVRGAEPADPRRDDGYALVYCDHGEDSLVSILTSGLRQHTAGAPVPQELICTARAEQEDGARHLTAVTAELLLESNSRVGYGALIMNDRSLLDASAISGSLAAPHPYLDDTFDLLHNDAGTAVLQVITLVPVTRGEAQLVARQGPDALYDEWERHDTDLTDLRRPSTV